MTRLASRSLGVPLAVTGAALLGLTPMIDSGFAYADSLTGVAVPTDPDIGLIMGGSGQPIPGADFVDAVNSLYVQPNFPGTSYPGTLADGLVTPEDLYPLTGVHSLPLDTSVSEGVAILNSSIDTNIAAGDSSTVFGYSQSGIIASLESEQLDPLGTPSTDPVDFVLIGDPMNPDGGFWERFAGLDIASIGATLYGATPADDFSTVIYTAEYDGVADFPQYPLNLLSDLNAELGFLYVHGTYPDLTPTQVTPVADGGDAIALMTSGPTETTYYMIPTTDLPLLDPVRDIPGTGFGLFPPLSDIEKLPGLLLSGTEQGIQNFIGDFTGTGPDPVTLSIGSLLDPSSAALPSDPATSITDIANALSSAASALYSALLPTADLINSLVTTIPAYDASIFTGNLEAGNVLDALGLPIAADTGLVSMGALLEISVVADAGSAALSDLTSLIS
jgi:hypothetical protein